MADYKVQETSLVAIADAIREKAGTSDALVFPEGFVEAVAGIETGGGSSGGDEWFNDGNTHIWISLPEHRTSPMLGVCPNGTVTVDWGDGTEPDTLTGASTGVARWTPTHNYAEPGDYVITLIVDGEIGFYGSSNSSQYSGILRHSSGADRLNRVYQAAVRKVEMGNGVASIRTGAFYNCHSIASVVIPEGVTSIGNNAFGYCYSLTSVVIPGSVTSIGNYAFSYDSGVRYYDFTACTSVPALINADAFSGISADCQMLVPAALYDEWIAATNWATYASQIVAV